MILWRFAVDILHVYFFGSYYEKKNGQESTYVRGYVLCSTEGAIPHK